MLLKAQFPATGVDRANRAIACRRAARLGLTLVEMLIAMALTLVMMAAVVTVVANVSGSVANRRSAIEMTSGLRQVRNALQRDLAGATCPGIPWQRPASSNGYIEVIEGPQCDFDPSVWLRDTGNPSTSGTSDAISDNTVDGIPDDLDGNGPIERLDLSISTLPSSNLARLPGSNVSVTANNASAVTDGGGLGDWDDILMLTVRNEAEPFVGRVPTGVDANSANFPDWGSQNLTSTLAEVVWFAVENPVESPDAQTFAFGEPGLRTIYRRALLIAPSLNYGFNINDQTTGPGVVRVLAAGVDETDVTQALASIVAFQERYDLSVRLEWNPLLGAAGRWVIVANSLADLTKRENRYEHFGGVSSAVKPFFPFAAVTSGFGRSPNENIQVVHDPEFANPTTDAEGRVASAPNSFAASYRLETIGEGYFARPLAIVGGNPGAATVRAIRDENNRVVGFTPGFVPLGGSRRGEDVMMTDALAFDLRVYDPEAPLLAEVSSSISTDFPGDALEPSDPGWGFVLARDASSTAGSGQAPTPVVLSRGAYVDLGYASLHFDFAGRNAAVTGVNLANAEAQRSIDRLFGNAEFSGSPRNESQLRVNSDVTRVLFDPFRTYDTWSMHYENNGVNEDLDRFDGDFVRLLTGAEVDALRDINQIDPPQLFDEGTDGFDTPAVGSVEKFFGPDDAAERETSPPYDARLRGIQVGLRAYEPDSRQIREVKVRQTFVPK